MEWYIVLSILVVSLSFFLFLGLPVAFSLGFLSIICALVFWPGTTGLYGVALAGYGHMGNYTLVCVPLFILMAQLVMHSRMGTDSYEVADRFLRRLPGGLGMTSAVFGAIFGAVCGASTAGTATVGLLSLPEMIKREYQAGMSGAIVAFSGALSILIPPSVILILYGTLANESIGALFAGGIIPGILMTVLALAYIFIRVLIDPDVAPRDDVRFTWKEKFASLSKVWSLLTVIFILLFTIYTGVATPTEASAIACLAVFIIAFVKKNLDVKTTRKALLHTVKTTAMIGWIIIGATSFGYVIIYSGCAAELTDFVVSLPLPTTAVVMILMLGFLIMGMFLDPAAIVMMTTPIILPILTALEIDTLWFGILMAVNMCAGNISPPMGLNLYIVKGLVPDKIKLAELFKAAVPFIILDIVTIGLIMIFPEIVTWLPSLIV
ncbi:TRAP transporter large permease [Desulfobacula toluolica]|uniref:DctM6: TRAP dicarboxylate transport system permease n=1 Tax=Desulfobacula toluolica (strain DSM 7467 / Tol2) TaxID=651182 RepID=K0NF00_DESTT|nr:TRAP transporter large permease [Desulfobacula toluolica]CCK79716.1 DctM6: TRAP dicarboxylate transport system permease, precursor [Desulfobacula toluolica Tol2]